MAGRLSNIASQNGHTEISGNAIETNLKLHVNAKDNDGWMAKHWASLYGYTEIVELLEDSYRN